TLVAIRRSSAALAARRHRHPGLVLDPVTLPAAEARAAARQMPPHTRLCRSGMLHYEHDEPGPREERGVNPAGAADDADQEVSAGR
ncbi:histidine utilization repressor, partial [Burkholderia pseudomallei]